MSQASTAPRSEVVGSDLGQLFRRYSKHLERIVRYGVRAPEPVIEDACQFAWLRLVDNQAQVARENTLAWLVKTAVHEALKLTARHGRENSLDAELDWRGEFNAPGVRPGPADVCEQRERLGTLSSLPTRQQRLLWLRALGLSYNEIATRNGCTARTVERQLQRARAELREAAP